MARFKKNVPVLLARTRATGFPLLHIQFLHSYLVEDSEFTGPRDWKPNAVRLYQDTMRTVHAVCLQVEAVGGKSILFGQAGDDAQQRLQHVRLLTPVPAREYAKSYRVKGYFEAIRSKLMKLTFECSRWDFTIPKLCNQEKYAAADIANASGIVGSDYLEYLEKYPSAYQRLAIYKAECDFRHWETTESASISFKSQDPEGLL